MRKKNFLTIFLFPNIWDISSWEAMEVEKYKEIGDVVSYELGNLINKKLVQIHRCKEAIKIDEKTKRTGKRMSHLKIHKVSLHSVLKLLRKKNIVSLFKRFQISKSKEKTSVN